MKQWRVIARSYDQRNMSLKSSAYAALMSNICERDRAKDVEQVDDILRTFVNETNKFENRFGKVRDEEKMLAVKKLMLSNFRFRGTTMSGHRIVKYPVSSSWTSTCLDLRRGDSGNGWPAPPRHRPRLRAARLPARSRNGLASVYQTKC